MFMSDPRRGSAAHCRMNGKHNKPHFGLVMIYLSTDDLEDDVDDLVPRLPS